MHMVTNMDGSRNKNYEYTKEFKNMLLSIRLYYWNFAVNNTSFYNNNYNNYNNNNNNNNHHGKEKATFIMLVRNWELPDALSSIRQIEERFNHKYKYTWTFLNDIEFSEEFKTYTTSLCSGKTQYGLVPKEHWSFPKHIDLLKAQECIEDMTKREVIYGFSISYRHMCRFYSGFFFRHNLLKDYDYYWRVEPNINFYCNVDYDPFKYMRKNNKKYGFVMSIPEYIETIPTLWNTTKNFFNLNPKYIAKNNAVKFIIDNDKLTNDSVYNLCHFWSNFEIGNLNFFRSKKYLDYFNYLDKSGGFYYERWGDAPVHTIGASIMLSKDEIHHFADFGYYHAPWGRCPSDEESHYTGRCVCDRAKSFDFNLFSCMPRWYYLAGNQKGSEPYTPRI